MSKQHRDDVTTVYGPSLWSHQLGSEDKPYWRGVVFTRQGIVATYRQQNDDHTLLHFIWQGKWYTRNIPAYYSDRYTITLARRFAEEIAG
jgi:hypothetical protein